MDIKILLLIVIIIFLGFLSIFDSFVTMYPEKDNDITTIQGVLNIYNWEDYLSEEVIMGFQEKYGVIVNLETFQDTDDVLIALQIDSARHDIIVAEDDDIEHFVKLRFLKKLDHAKTPNMVNINKNITQGIFDKDMNYCVIYVPGYTGMAINPIYVNNYDRDRSVFWNEEYRGKITMPISSQEILINSIYYLGYDPNNITQEQLREAEIKSLELKNMDILFGDPIQQREWLVKEDAWIGYTYSTEVVFIQEENEDINFFAPKEGVRLWADFLCVPRGAQNIEEAHLFLNYLLESENMAKNSQDIYAMMPGINIEKYMDVDILAKIKGLDFPEDKNILAKSRYSNYYENEEIQKILSNISRELNMRE